MKAIEKEIIVLNCVLDVTSDLLSKSLINLDEDNGIVSSVSAIGHSEKRLFSIILLELISPLDTSMFPGSKTALDYLVEIGHMPILGGVKKAKLIKRVTTDFQIWLNKTFSFDIYSAVGRQIKVDFKRQEVIYFCGNNNKHFGFRLGTVAKKMSVIYQKAGLSSLAVPESLRLTEDIETWLYDDVFECHFSTICEYISEVNNSIQAYLLPVFKKRFRKIDGFNYRYSMPRGIKDDFWKRQYYELLNKVRQRNNMPELKIIALKWLKNRY